MSRFAQMGTRRRLASGAIAAALLATAACSGTVEASYRPPPPAPPTPAPTTVVPTPTAAPTTQADAAACGPDQVAVQVGDVQADASSRAVPLLIRTRGASACGVANPVGIELVDAAGAPLNTRVQTAELPAGRTAVDVIPAAQGATPTAAAPGGPPPTGPPPTPPAEPGTGAGGAVMVWLQWRAEPSVRTVDPATDCVDATGLLLTLADAAPPIPIEAKLKACDGGTVYVSPAEPGIG